MSDMLNSKNLENTSDLTKEVAILNTLRKLKNNLEINGLTKETQHDIDVLSLTTYDNSELNSLKKEILSFYNNIEKESRTFCDITYATLLEKEKAKQDYTQMIELKKEAEKANSNLIIRKNILNQINSKSYTMKNIGSLLYEIDTLCRTLDGITYKNINELEVAIKELDTLDEFIKIDEILDEKIEIIALINIKNKIAEIDKFKYSNKKITERIISINKKINKLEKELLNSNGHFNSLEEVKLAQDEIYYIETESYKFDLLAKDGLKYFLELMSLKEFKSKQAKELINAYRKDYLRFVDKDIQKEEIKKEVSISKKKRNKFRLAVGGQLFTFLLFVGSIAIGKGTLIAASAIVFGVSIPILCGYMIYYKISNAINNIKKKHFSKK